MTEYVTRRVHEEVNNDQLKIALYIKLESGHPPDGAVGKNSLVCYLVWEKKKPPVKR